MEHDITHDKMKLTRFQRQWFAYHLAHADFPDGGYDKVAAIRRYLDMTNQDLDKAYVDRFGIDARRYDSK